MIKSSVSSEVVPPSSQLIADSIAAEMEQAQLAAEMVIVLVSVHPPISVITTV